MLIGYARVSTLDQNLNLQLDALHSAGCQKIFSDKLGSSKERPEFDKALEHLRLGDTLVIWRLDRLGRNVKQLVNLADELKQKGINLWSITENIDTNSPMGEMLFTICSAFAELELNSIRERTIAGLNSARARGKFGGRPSLSKEKINVILTMHKDTSIPISDIAKNLGVSRSSIYRYLKKARKND